VGIRRCGAGHRRCDLEARHERQEGHRPHDAEIDDVVLLIGAADMGASTRFCVEHGLSVKRSFPGRYVEFAAPAGAIKLALYPGRAGLAKDAGTSPDGNGPHGIAVNSNAGSPATLTASAGTPPSSVSPTAHRYQPIPRDTPHTAKPLPYRTCRACRSAIRTIATLPRSTDMLAAEAR
jgi:hypothetical protein